MSEIDRREMKRMVEAAKQKNAKANCEYSKKRLIDNLKKKFNTTMIGSINYVENHFGDLWGHGKREEELTNEEKWWRTKWHILRTEILNNGNNQLRAAMNEVSEYSMTWEKYTLTFLPVSQQPSDIVTKKE